ncbi:RHTO0S25e00980g1_1 [Rhodotorula toruloides]|uniref:RHTO0S25e00980g1_1 n=1 Tax=Rhodotorula toruloides TaxID=5286 RepID=A0A061BQG4_RHOTO|nr:RHTO0S25e00980g1_1 [Rhodotorula toruloides]
MAAVYSEPIYVHSNPAATVLSEARPTRLSPAALASLNYLSDELLHLIVHAALHSAPIETTPNGDAHPVANAPVPLEEDEVLTTERFKSALARILGPTSLAKECILEAELAVRELVRRASPSLRADGALKKTSGRGIWGSPVLPETASLPGPAAGETKDSLREKVAKQAVEVFRCLRAWVMQVSGVGAAAPLSGAPASLTQHLVALSPPKPPPSSARSPHISFLLALYVERILTHLSTHILRLVASSASSRPSSDTEATATVTDLEAALVQDQLVWNWVQGMRVRAFIEQEGKNERARSRNGGMGRRKSTNSSNVASPVSSNAGGVPLPNVGTPERRPSLAGSTAVPSTIEKRRTSFASTAVNSSNGAKAGMGLGIGTRANGAVKAAALDEDSFDQLLNSGKTIKLSSTPDRLRFEQQNKRMSGSQSMSALFNSTDSPSRHLKARAPQFGGILSEDSGAGQPVDGRDRPSGSRKDSLIDVLNSPPPWSNGDATASRRQSIVPKRPIPQDDPLHPVSVAMRVQGSQNSVSTVDSAASEAIDGEDALASPGARTRALKAKDERRDLASERQINNDLMAFFAVEPPSLPRPMSTIDPRPSFDDSPSKDKSAASKKSRGGLRGLVSRVTGGSSGSGKKEDSAGPVSPTSPPPNSPPPPSYRSRAGSPPHRASRMHSIDGGESSNARTAFRAAGFSDSIARAATKYTPPPGLGAPSARDARQSRRSMSVPTVEQPSVPPYSSPPPPASAQKQRNRSPRLPQNGTSSAEASASEDSHNSRLAPPIPIVDAAPVVTPPRRSSSLKRSRRERETSGASSSTVSTTRALPAVETTAPPVTVEPLVTTASATGAAAPPAQSSASSKAAVAQVAAAAALAPIVADAAAHELRLDHQHAQPSTNPPPSLTPVAEAAASPTTPSAALTPSNARPSPARPTSSSGLSGKSLVSHLRELRSAMLAYAHSKEDCVELVEAMLRDEARRVEKLAQREREETLARERGGDVDGVQEAVADFAAVAPSRPAEILQADAARRSSGEPDRETDEAPNEIEDAETHQARLAEYFLTCDGQSSKPEDKTAATGADQVADNSAQAQPAVTVHPPSVTPAPSSLVSTLASGLVLRPAKGEATA